MQISEFGWCCIVVCTAIGSCSAVDVSKNYRDSKRVARAVTPEVACIENTTLSDSRIKCLEAIKKNASGK